jgi:Helix-turn-helix domain
VSSDRRTPPEKAAALIALRDEMPGTDAAAQRERLLAALRLFPISTFEASRFLDVYHVAARIKELRDLGNEIQTHWVDAETEAGVLHRIGLYALKREAAAEVTA